MKHLISTPSSCFVYHIQQNVRCLKIPRPHQCLHTSTLKSANPLPITAAGPPPSAPLPAASQYGQRVDRRRRQAELLKRGQDLRASQMRPGSAMKKRFWKDVTVQTSPGKEQIQFHPSIYLFQVANAQDPNRRGIHNPPRQTPRTSPALQRGSPHPSLQTPSRNSHSPRMGPSGLSPTSFKTTLDPPDIHSKSRLPSHARRQTRPTHIDIFHIQRSRKSR